MRTQIKDQLYATGASTTQINVSVYNTRSLYERLCDRVKITVLFLPSVSHIWAVSAEERVVRADAATNKKSRKAMLKDLGLSVDSVANAEFG